MGTRDFDNARPADPPGRMDALPVPDENARDDVKAARPGFPEKLTEVMGEAAERARLLPPADGGGTQPITIEVAQLRRERDEALRQAGLARDQRDEAISDKARLAEQIEVEKNNGKGWAVVVDKCWEAVGRGGFGPGWKINDTIAFIKRERDGLQKICAELEAKLVEERKRKIIEAVDAPMALVLTCPACGERHIDEGEFATKHHHTHACQHCGLAWRPAIGPTVGVRFLPGFKNAVPRD